ncbi:MAG TPA: DUF402 domain-containing protein [Chloroflexota bacterium]
MLPRPFEFEFVRPPDRRSTFRSTLLEASDRLLVVTHTAFPSKPLVYQGQEVMADGYTAVWFLFKDKPYDIGRFYRPDGMWTGYYVDILEPVHWTDDDPTSLEPIVDLFLDLWIAPDGSYQILDEDEFDEALNKGHLTPPQAHHARSVAAALVDQIGKRDFPPPEATHFRLPVRR